MRKLSFLCSPLLATLAVAPLLPAATLYVSPTGADTDPCTADTPCSLTTGAATATAGDTVILRDGTYTSKLDVANSGTASAWITFQADECATPIIQGDGLHDDDKPTGVGSGTATYLRFIGLVSRGWNSGFSNGWTGSGTTTANGNFEYKYCIGEGNGRTGFTFFSAAGIHIQNSIAAHNGMSALHSWSSGIVLYEAQGTSNKIEGNISFENVDEQQKTDGSGFIADESSNNATFINNIAFGNAGSCLRLTKSSGVKFINNTCYHNARDSRDQGPTNPGELYITDTTSGTSTSFMNNVFIATGTGPGAAAVYHQPTSGWTTNIAQNGGSTTMFTSPEGTNPDFTLSSSATTLIGKGTSGSSVPTNDIGFDPKCITKKAPTAIGNYSYSNYSWFAYSVDFDYIKSIGGVAKCFNPKTRSGTPDIGAYASGTVTKGTVCVKSTGGAPSTGGAASTGGAQAAGGSGTTAAGGVSASGGTTSASATVSTTAGGATSATGGSKAAGGTTAGATGGTSATGGTKSGGTTVANAGGTKVTGGTTGTNTTNAPVGGTTGNASTSNTAAGGTTANSTTGTTAGNTGGSASTGGATGTANATSTTATGTTATNAGGATLVGGASSTRGSVVTATNAGDAKDTGGCGCRVAGSRTSSAAAWGSLGLLGMLLLRTSRRRRISK